LSAGLPAEELSIRYREIAGKQEQLRREAEAELQVR
jgi:hypothetical protein